MVVNVLIFLFIPLYAFGKMIGRFIQISKKGHRIEPPIALNPLETMYATAVFCMVLLGLFLNSFFGVKGGEPLTSYSDTGQPDETYASLSSDHLLTVILLLTLGFIAYWYLCTHLGEMTPVINAVCSILMILNGVFGFFYLMHTGFSHYENASIEMASSIFLMQTGYLSLIFLYIAKLTESMMYFMHAQKEAAISTNRFIRFLYRFSFNYPRIALLWVICLFPVLVIIQLILTLFGQSPDSAIQTFFDTSSFNYSKIPAPPPKMINGDGHYLCTVSVKGHPKLVKPLRAGIRYGEKITVNRQLLVANAFENILEEYTPRCHKAIRYIYDKYGYPFSKHISTRWSADAVYLLMKPAEWLFLVILYTVDKHPENRIHIQYSELRR